MIGRESLSTLEGMEYLSYLVAWIQELSDPDEYLAWIGDSFKRRENVTIELPSGEKLTGLYDEEHKGKHLVMVGDKTYSVDDDHIWKMEREKKKRLIPAELKERIEKRLSEIEKSIKSSDEKEVKRLEKERDRLNAQLSKYRMDSIKTNTDMSKVKDGKEFRVRVDSIKKLLGIKDSIKEIKDEVFFEDNLEKAWKEKYKDSTLSFSYSPKELRVRSKNPVAEVRVCKEMWSVKDYDTLDTESQDLAQMVEAAANNTTNTRGKFKDIKDDSGEEQYDRGVEAGKQGLEKGWTKYETIHYYEELHKQFMEGLEKGFERVEDSEDTVKVGDIIPLNLNGNKSEVVVLKVVSKDKVLGGEDSHHFVNFYERKEGKWLPSEVEVESKDVESEDFGDYRVFYDESEEGYLWEKK